MEHIEEADIHLGDSACALPPITIGRGDIAQIRAATEAIAAGVGVRGLLNVQYALAGGVLYVLEANPRASRTVPFVSKATAVPLAKAAALVMLGSSIASLRASGGLPETGGVFVSVANRDKRAMVFPVKRLADLGFEIWATSGTAEVLRRNGVRAKIVRKHSDGAAPGGEPTVVTRILDGEVDLIVNTPWGRLSAG